MVGKWIDIIILVIVALCLFKGLRRGLIREVFSIVGAVLAVAVAYRGYQNLSLYLVSLYPLQEWQAQAIAFVVLILGISLIAAAVGYLWSRAIRLTPFAILDHIGGAAFGVAKVGIVLIVLVLAFSAFGLPAIDQVLDESSIVREVRVLLPFVYQYIDTHWPTDWTRPLWLDSEGNPAV